MWTDTISTTLAAMSPSERMFMESSQRPLLVAQGVKTGTVNNTLLAALLGAGVVAPTVAIASACVETKNVEMFTTVVRQIKHGWKLGGIILQETMACSNREAEQKQFEMALLVRIHEHSCMPMALDVGPNSLRRSWSKHWHVRTLEQRAPATSPDKGAPARRLEFVHKCIRRWGCIQDGIKPVPYKALVSMAEVWVDTIVVRSRHKCVKRLMEIVGPYVKQRNCVGVAMVAGAMINRLLVHGDIMPGTYNDAIHCHVHNSIVSSAGQFAFACNVTKQVIPRVGINVMAYNALVHASIDWMAAAMSYGHMPLDVANRSATCCHALLAEPGGKLLVRAGLTTILMLLQCAGATAVPIIKMPAATAGDVLAVLVSSNIIAERGAFSMIRCGTINPHTRLHHLPPKVVMSARTKQLARMFTALVLTRAERSSFAAFVSCSTKHGAFYLPSELRRLVLTFVAKTPVTLSVPESRSIDLIRLGVTVF